MKIFISCSGGLSRAVARIIYDYMGVFIQSAECFFCEESILTGSDWRRDVFDELRDAKYGIIVLTPANYKNEWINFEAGALAHQATTPVSGLLFGDLTPSSITGPLTTFQMLEYSKDSFQRLIREINNASPPPRVQPKSLELLFGKFLADVDEKVRAEINAAERAEKEVRKLSEDEKLDEILKLLSHKPRSRVKTRTDDISTDLYEVAAAREKLTNRIYGRLRLDLPSDEFQQLFVYSAPDAIKKIVEFMQKNDLVVPETNTVPFVLDSGLRLHLAVEDIAGTVWSTFFSAAS